MPLDTLAPDQRAVVQLVLQQGRSYADLAGMLGIEESAVRQRAHAGIASLGGGSAPSGAGDVTDFLLGQQTVSERETTRTLLSGDPSLYDWAARVSSDLRGLSSDLPELPAPSGGAATPVPVAPDPEPEPAVTDPDVLDTAIADRANASLGRPRPRPRPLRDETETLGRPSPRRSRSESDEAPAPGSDRGDRPASRLGGALLIGGLAILVAAILIFVINGGDDDGNGDNTAGTGTTAEETATPDASATPQPLGQIPLAKVEGQTGRGVLALYGQPGQGLVFTLAAERVPALAEGEAYAMWLTTDDGSESQLLGFFQEAPQGERRQLATSGPRDEDAARFAQWLTQYDNIVVSKETVNRPESPSTIVLSGDLPEGGGAE